MLYLTSLVVNSDTFTTGLKNVLFFMIGVIEGIVDAISTVWGFLKQIPWLDSLVKNMGSMDMSGGFSGAQKVGKTTGKILAYGFVAKKVLGLTPLTAMWVQSAGGALQGLGRSDSRNNRFSRISIYCWLFSSWSIYCKRYV